MYYRIICLLAIVISISNNGNSQKIDSVIQIPGKTLDAVNAKLSGLNRDVLRTTDKYLTKFQKLEKKLYRKVAKRDPGLAKTLFSGIDEKYNSLKTLTKVKSRYPTVYSYIADSVSTGLKFIQTSGLGVTNAASKVVGNYDEAFNKLEAVNHVSGFLRERRELLKKSLAGFGKLRGLHKLREEVIHYKLEFENWKSVLTSTTKAEEKIMSLIRSNTDFVNYLNSESVFAAIFGKKDQTATQTISSFQPRHAVLNDLEKRFGGNQTNPVKHVQDVSRSEKWPVAEVGSYLGIKSSGSVGVGDDADLKNFTPNSQKPKTIAERLEYSTNFQSQKAKHHFPVTTDIGLSVGYKLNDKSVVGLGSSFKLGLGKSWDQLDLSSEGVSLRSFIDWKIKGELYIAGGYERNIRKSMDFSGDRFILQESGLIGLKKTYQVSKKVKGDIKLLWDFMSYSQSPISTPIVFRLGYSLK